MFIRAAAYRALGDALQRTLVGARIRTLRERNDRPHTYVIGLRTPGENHLLGFYLDAGLLLFEEESLPAPATPSTFTMYLRKHVTGGVVRDLELDADRHVLALRLETVDGHWVLQFEMDGAQSNLLLLSADDRVLQAADMRALQHRGLSLGAVYTPPSPRRHREHDAPLPVEWPTDDAALWVFLRERKLAAWAEDRFQTELRQLRRRIKRAQKRAARRVQNVLQDLDRAENAEILRHEADLLQSVQHQLRRGMTHIDVPDWENDDMATTRIALDPAQPVQEEIRQRYRVYRRMRDAETKILERLDVVEDQQQRIDTARQALDSLTTIEEILALRESLERAGLIPRIDQAQRVREIARKPYREALSSDGFRILVGRTAKDNDTLSLRIARGRDLWLHARDVAGSHVIIWREGREDVIPERTIHEAALLAAQYSSAKNDTTVDVGFTERKHISKPKGSSPGSVQVAAMRTMLVTPDEEKCRELFSNARVYRAGTDSGF